MINIDATTLEKSFSYADFRTFVSDALANNPEKLQLDESYMAYAELNETRLKRLDKTLSVDVDTAQVLQHLRKEYIWLVISESWCGDAAQSVPMLNKMAETSGKIDLKIVFRDQNLNLMDQFLTNGGRSIPKLIVVEKNTLQVEGSWGPRPGGAVKLLNEYKEKHGQIDENGKVELQKWYTQDKGRQVEQEVLNLMKQIDNL